MSKSKKVVKIQERPRNLLALAPIMQKGGVHGKTPKSHASCRTSTDSKVRSGGFCPPVRMSRMRLLAA
jgi:hypothetical protein